MSWRVKPLKFCPDHLISCKGSDAAVLITSFTCDTSLIWAWWWCFFLSPANYILIRVCFFCEHITIYGELSWDDVVVTARSLNVARNQCKCGQTCVIKQNLLPVVMVWKSTPEYVWCTRDNSAATRGKFCSTGLLLQLWSCQRCGENGEDLASGSVNKIIQKQ